MNVERDPIPILRVSSPEWTLDAPRLEQIERSGTYSNFGPQERSLRERISELVGFPADNIATASNATLALQGAVETSGAAAWRIPAYTFVASLQALEKAGRRIIIDDVDPETWELGRSKLRRQGRLHVLRFGRGLRHESEESSIYSGFPLVIDGAASLGGFLLRPTTLTPRACIVFSLHATKALGAGEGAVVVFADDSWAQDFREWTNFGFSEDRVSKRSGTNAKLSEVMSAVAHSRLDQWESEIEEWLALRARAKSVEIALGLDSALGSDEISPYWVVDLGTPVHKLAIQNALTADRIASRDWWGRGLGHSAPYIRRRVRHVFPNTLSISGRSLGLPFFRGMGSGEFERVWQALELGLSS